MHVMMLHNLKQPLEWSKLPDRSPGSNEIRLRVGACGVYRIDLHVVDRDLPNPVLPIIPRHEIVGRTDAVEPDVEGLCMDRRVGIPWLGHTCSVCPYCRASQENLCDCPAFPGYTRNGGFEGAAILVP